MLNIRPATRGRRRHHRGAWCANSPNTKSCCTRPKRGPADFLRELESPNPVIHVLIAEWNGEPAGFALYFFNFSTFVGRPGLYLEDLFVRPAQRAHGIGRALLRALARIAQERGCGRMEWAVLDWNEPALRFYKSLDARQMKEWIIHRLTPVEIAQARRGSLNRRAP